MEGPVLGGPSFWIYGKMSEKERQQLCWPRTWAAMRAMAGMKAIAYDSYHFDLHQTTQWPRHVRTSKKSPKHQWKHQLLKYKLFHGRSLNRCTPDVQIVNEVLGSLLCRQSDVVHQSVFELIHTDDRAIFRQQLHFALNPPTGADGDGKKLRMKTKACFYSGFFFFFFSGEFDMVHGSVKWFWCVMSYLHLCSQWCRVVVMQWCTVPSSFPQRTPPSWRGTLCVASAVSWTIPLAFW